MAIKLALQIIDVRVEYGFFFGGLIVIAAQLICSTNLSQLGRILHLSPAFKLQDKANIQLEPFFAILLAMLCSNIIPGDSIECPPTALIQPLQLGSIPDADEAAENDESAGDNKKNMGRDKAQQCSIPGCLLQVATNAMVLHHPSLNCRDIHHISVIGCPGQPFSDVWKTPAVKNFTPLMNSLSLYPLQPWNLLCAPRIPSTTVEMVTLKDRIQLCIMKLVAELHSVMILCELYMYKVALRDCSLVPRFYRMFQRPVGGWFEFLLENVRDSLE
ncbi:hypothetical protein EDD85DRAFT_951753 [Armillaria nabsnona]|nr:hypothetical protein EDD85DRAFT_951753 [Armillaria nabsnona]